MQPMTPGTTVYRDFGPLNIRIDMHHDGVAITVTAHPTLNRAFTNLDEARAYLTYLRDEGKAGKPVWLIEVGAGVLTSAAAVLDDAETALVADINTTLDAATAVRTEVAEQLRGDIAGIMAEADPNWRRTLRAQVMQAAKHTNQRHDYSRTRVGTKPPTRAQLDLIAHHQGGVVTTRPGQAWTVLKALYARIGGVRVYRPGTRIITALRYEPAVLDALLSQHGITETSQEKAA
jgi:hypothetical protein